MNKRAENDIWSGLYEFYLIETEEAITSIDEIQDDFINELLKENEVNQLVESKKHILSHQRIFASFWQIELSNSRNEALPQIASAQCKFFTIDEIEALPKSALTAIFLEKLIA